jgi:hypothetical protein
VSTEKPAIWWTYDYAPTRWAIVVSFVSAWLLAVTLLYSDVVQVLAAGPWWEDLIVAVATVAVPVLALFELRHSAEANRLRDEANDERRKANELRTESNLLREKNAQLAAALDAERNKHLAQIAMNTARPSQEPAANLKIHPADRSRYILKPVGQGGAQAVFYGGYFEFRLRVENSGNRNSTVDKYKIWISQFDREYSIAPTRPNYVQGRYCQHFTVAENFLNEGGLIRIPADDNTKTGSLWFALPELTLEMFLKAGLQIQGPEIRFSNLHCRLTLIDSNGILASGDFELSES